MFAENLGLGKWEFGMMFAVGFAMVFGLVLEMMLDLVLEMWEPLEMTVPWWTKEALCL
jgi:hypothetical protein